MRLANGVVLNSSATCRRLNATVPFTFTVWADTSQSPTMYYAESNHPDKSDVWGTDAATVIQNAIEGGNSVFIKDGTYPLTAQITINKTNFTLMGESITATIIDGSSLSDYAIKIGDGKTKRRYIKIDTLGITGGININYASELYLSHLAIGANTGLYAINVSTALYQFSIEYSSFFSTTGAGGINLEGDVTAGSIFHNLFSNCANYGIRLYGTTTPLRRGITIASNWFENNETYTGDGIYAYACDSLFIRDNHMVNLYGDYGIVLDGPSGTYKTFRSKVYSNWIKQNVTTGIYLNYAADNDVYSNLISADTTDINLTGEATRNKVWLNTLASIVDSQDTTNPTIRNEVHNNYGFVTENRGTSEGTGSEQTIPHGLAGTPTYVFLSPASANPEETSARDATNLYITADTGEEYFWRAEYVP